MKTKILTIGVLLMMVIAPLVFGGGQQEEGQEPVDEKPDKLVLMNAGSLSGDPGIARAIDQWSAKTGIEIEVIEQGEAHLFDKELSALSSNDPSIDIMAANDRWIRDWARAGWLVNLDDIAKDGTVSRYGEGADEGLKYDGSYYGLHQGNMVLMMYYRTDLLEEYGMSEPPKTWSEMIDFGKWATQDKDGDGQIDQWGLVHVGVNQTHFGDFVYTLIHQLGGKVYDNNELSVDSPEARKALQAVVDLREKHGITPEGIATYETNSVLQALQSGNAAMAVTWTWMGKLLNAEDSEVRNKWSWTTIPVLPGGEKSSLAITTPLVINHASKHPSYAKDFIDYFTSYEGRIDEVIYEFGNVALMPEVYNEEEVMNPPQDALDIAGVSADFWKELQGEILEAIKVVEVEYAHKQGELDRAFWPEMNAALSGGKDVDQAIKDAANQMKKINDSVQ